VNDEYVNKGKVMATAAWSVVVCLMVTAWVFILVTPHTAIGGMFAATGCAVSALAAVLHIRCYAVRVMCLVRASSALGPLGSGDGPRPVRGL
jgi:hypothetical protein